MSLDFRNYTEDAVLHLMDEVLKNYPGCCKCEQCRMDIAILALNHLPPRYISTQKGNLYAKIEEMSIEYKIKVIGEIAKAVEIVSRNPRHAKAS